MAILLFHVDAFTREPFRGNPAAVVVLDGMKEPDWMQAVAREMNVSETAFALPIDKEYFALRWFTPETEVPLCGHATLATAAVLFGENVVTERITFETLSGQLVVEPEGNMFSMSFPAYPTVPAEGGELVAALHVTPLDVRYAQGAAKLLVRVPDEAAVVAARPDFRRLLAAANPLGIKGVIVTASSGRGEGASPFHFVSRYFAPWVGIDEDPVTGSAHCVLGPYWSGHLLRKKMVAAQRSSRGGEIGVDVRGDRVVLTGSAVVLSRGVWTR
jgi:PhzF family phenazine biosynthesis protein